MSISEQTHRHTQTRRALSLSLSSCSATLAPRSRLTHLTKKAIFRLDVKRVKDSEQTGVKIWSSRARKERVTRNKLAQVDCPISVNIENVVNSIDEGLFNRCVLDQPFLELVHWNVNAVTECFFDRAVQLFKITLGHSCWATGESRLRKLDEGRRVRQTLHTAQVNWFRVNERDDQLDWCTGRSHCAQRRFRRFENARS